MCPVVSQRGVGTDQLLLVPAASGCQGPRSSRKPGGDGSGVFSKHVAQQLQDLPHQGRGGVVLGDFCNEVVIVLFFQHTLNLKVSLIKMLEKLN